ncbi:ATP synthase F(0) complex subunit B1, mitochondrial-like [Sycon ciliatum]|uniref:ATP synthase F(0) complex subunit B1, mitochondrial-like n=1 Tax=Sycon ciliatum TaxID=27933 RepID=UPI0020AA14F6|eukprot:scpid43747/ scgid19960/ ATP synthase subunit b, mitochondrial
MLARCARRPLGLAVRPVFIRYAGSTAAAAQDAPTQVVPAQRKYVFELLPNVKKGFFGSQLSEFMGERLGVTGSWTLGFGLTTYLWSKEWILYNGETCLIIPQLGVLYVCVSKLASFTSDGAEKANTHIFNRLYNRKDAVADILQTGITAANDVEAEVSVRTDVFDILRTNASMYRDTLYRERAAALNNEVLKRLQHQAELEAARRRIKQTHMITWIQREVVKDVSTTLDHTAMMDSCLDELKGAVDMAVKEKAVA